MNTYDFSAKKEAKGGAFASVGKLLGLLKGEKRSLGLAFVAILTSSTLNLLAPYLVGRAIDTSVQSHDLGGVYRTALILLGIFAVAFVAQYLQMILTGGVGQRVLFRLRNSVFAKLQELPIAFFDRNRSGDLISRINNDTDKLSQFFSETLVRFVGSIFIIGGSAAFLIGMDWRLGLVAVAPAVVTSIVTQLLGSWIKRKSAKSLTSLGGLSAEVQESLSNFKVIVAFDRRDYFVDRFQKANKENYDMSVRAGLANGVFVPLYEFTAAVANFAVVAYGIALIAGGSLTIGALISFLLYIEKFYGPFRHLAMLWSSLQLALAGWDRVSDILALKSDLAVIPSSVIATEAKQSHPLLEFSDVHFRYPGGEEILGNVGFALQRGKTYALVGPTGGGKTTTASLMARLYDPTGGAIRLAGRDIRSYTPEERTKKIGFILQEPFLFSGTVRDNIVYGDDRYADHDAAKLAEVLKARGLDGLMERFERGLETPVSVDADSISLGQKQLVAFIRAVLREPELLILDEATANIDTVTERLLEEALRALPASTTRVIIAHRLNTIQNADEIFFVNGGTVVAAGSYEHAVELLMHGKRNS